MKSAIVAKKNRAVDSIALPGVFIEFNMPQDGPLT